MINQYQFLALNAFLKFHSLSFDQLITIWPRIFDPKNLGRISFEELHHFLDELSRGKLTKDSTLASRMFEDKMLEALESNGCLDPVTKDFITDAFRK